MKGFKALLAIIILIGFFMQAGRCFPKIPEPDNIFYGMVFINGQLITAGSQAIIALRLDPYSDPIASYIMGSNLNAGDFYILRVPIYAQVSEEPNIAQPGDEANIYINGEWAGIVIIGGRGRIQTVHLDTDIKDADGDGMTEAVEALLGTDPNNPDSDNDGLSDGGEHYGYGTDPMKWDTEGDGLLDGEEVNTYGTNPMLEDSDEDGLPDGWEVGYNLNPLSGDATLDSDSDGFTNLQEYKASCDPQDNAIYPNAIEKCDGKDNDCNGLADEEDAEGCIIYYKDQDEDGYGMDEDKLCLCRMDINGKYTATQGGDPDDLDPSVPEKQCMFIAPITATGQVISGAENVSKVYIGIDTNGMTYENPGPPLNYTVYMEIFDGLFKDFKQAVSEYEEWNLIVRVEDMAVSSQEGFFPGLSWNPNDFCPPDLNNSYLSLYAEDGEGIRTLLVSDMYQTTYYQTREEDGQWLVDTNTCIFNYYISWSEGVSVEMILPSGWSMISLPAILDNVSLQKLFSDAVVIYGYKEDTGYVRLTKADELEIGWGYWILFNEAKIYNMNSQPIWEYALPITDNEWKMIGGCTYPAKASIDQGTIRVIYGYLQGTGYIRIPESGNLEPGKGYWVLFNDITDEANLIVETN